MILSSETKISTLVLKLSFLQQLDKQVAMGTLKKVITLSNGKLNQMIHFYALIFFLVALNMKTGFWKNSSVSFNKGKY